jgi:integrase
MVRPRILERRIIVTKKGVTKEVTLGHLPKKWLTPQETESIIAVAARHSLVEAAALTLYSYGLRRSEVVGSDTLPGIRRRDVNLTASTIWIHGKGDPRQIVKDRELSFPPDVMSLIRPVLLQTPTPETKVFNVDEVTIWRHLKNYAQEAGVQDWEKVHPHRLRAYFANDAKWRRGLSDLDVRDLMRHKSLVQTQTYTGVSPPDYQAAKMRQIADSREANQPT